MKSNFDARKASENSDTLPDQASAYVPPRPVPQLSDHRTMDIKAIRVAAELDPRQAMTQLRMHAPPRRRRLSPFWIASLGIVALLVIGTYILLVSETPLPLISSDQSVSESPSAPVAAEPPIDLDAPLPDVAPRVAGPATASPPSTERAVGEVTAPAEPAARASEPITTADPTSTQRSTPARKSKPRQDPWLE